MYYKSRRNRFKNWIGNTNLKPYAIVFGVLAVISIVLFVVSKSNVYEYFSEKQTDNRDNNSISEINTEAQLTDSSTDGAMETEPLVVALIIEVNKYDNMVSVWNTVDGKKDSIRKLFNSSIYEELNTGTYSISEKNIWRLTDNNTYIQYSSKDSAELLFHSAQYQIQNRNYMNVETYNNIGSSNTSVKGITLTVADAKWIYENCPEGTVVDVINDENPDYGSMQADELRAIPDGIRWDPTDPDKNNKWVTTQIKFINGVTNHTIQVGSYFDAWDGIYATDIDGNNITNNITILGTVNTAVPGTYTIQYLLADFTGQVIREKAYITVTAGNDSTDSNDTGNDVVENDENVSNNEAADNENTVNNTDNGNSENTAGNGNGADSNGNDANGTNGDTDNNDIINSDAIN